MAERTVFERLAETLPEKERKDLLEKISRSMNFQPSIDENIYRKQMATEERERLVAMDLAKLSPLTRFFFWLRSALFGVNRKELLQSAKIRALKSTINHEAPGITGFETRDLSGRLAEAFFKLYVATLPVRHIYRKLMLKTREMEGAFVDLMESKIPELRIGLSDIISREDLQELFDQKGSESSIKRELLARLDEYSGHFDELVFDSMEDEIVPFFYLKDVVLFPYASFFQLFQFSVESLVPDQKPQFKSASAMLVLEYLEKMYFGLYSVMKIPEPFELSDGILNYLALLSIGGNDTETTLPARRGRPAAAVQGPLEEPEPDERSSDAEDQITAQEVPGINEVKEAAESLSTAFRTLYNEARKLDRSLPLAELIRYFLKDPYYKLYVYVPRLRLKDYFLAVLKMRFIAEFSSFSDQMRVESLERQLRRQLGSETLLNLQNYREYKTIEYTKLGLPYFTHTRSLTLLYNFIHWYYRESIQEVVKTLSNLVLVQNRITRNRLLQHASSMEDLEDKIVQFDQSLAPEAEEGKSFHRLRVGLSTETTHQQAFRTLVFQKDAQARSLVERGRDALTGLIKVFQELSDNQSEATKERMEAKYYVNSKLQSLTTLVAERLERTNTFSLLFAQLVKSEGG